MTYTPLEKAILLGYKELLRKKLTPQEATTTAPPVKADYADWEGYVTAKRDHHNLELRKKEVSGQLEYHFWAESVQESVGVSEAAMLATIGLLGHEGLLTRSYHDDEDPESLIITKEGLLAVRTFEHEV